MWTKRLMRICWYWSTKSTNYTNAWLDNGTQQNWKQNLQLKEQHSKFVFRNRINNDLKELSSQQLRSELAVCKSDEEKRYHRNVRLESRKRTAAWIGRSSRTFPRWSVRDSFPSYGSNDCTVLFYWNKAHCCVNPQSTPLTWCFRYKRANGLLPLWFFIFPGNVCSLPFAVKQVSGLCFLFLPLPQKR